MTIDELLGGHATLTIRRFGSPGALLAEIGLFVIVERSGHNQRFDHRTGARVGSRSLVAFGKHAQHELRR